MRYLGQGYEVAVDVPEAADAKALRDAFNATYAALYGRLIEGLDIEVLSWTLTLSESAPAQDKQSNAAASSPTSGRRIVGQSHVDREKLASGDSVAGPSAIVEDQTVVVVPENVEAQVEEDGSILMRLAAEQP